MNLTTKIAVETAVDPMPQVMDCLFGKCEILISDEILEALKKSHSFTTIQRGKKWVYTFHKRGRGTHVFFTFLVTKGEKGNEVSNLEYTTELGVTQKYDYQSNEAPTQKVYIMVKGEKLRKIINILKGLWAKR